MTDPDPGGAGPRPVPPPMPPPPGFPPGPLPPFGGPAPASGYPGGAVPPTNTMAILGLVFAFVAWPLGIVFSALGLDQTRQRREGGRGLALAGLIVSIALGVLTLLVLTTLVAGFSLTRTAASPATAAQSATAARTASGAQQTAAGTASSASSAGGAIDCNYTAVTSGDPHTRDVGIPPNPVPAQGSAVLTMRTGQGDLTLTLDRDAAPCAAASFVYLASQRFFDGSPCHREVNQTGFGVLQCGDPTGTGQGGPSYRYRAEVTPRTTYPRGTIAMANSGQPNSTGSQFFLCFTDTQLQPDYTAVGTVDQAGLAVLDKIAAAGNDGSLDPSPGGGEPKLPVTISAMTVR